MKLRKLSDRFNAEFGTVLTPYTKRTIEEWMKRQPEEKMQKFYIDPIANISPLKTRSIKLIKDYLNDVIMDIDQGFASNQLDNLWDREDGERKLQVLVEDFLLFLKLKYPESS